MGNKQTYCSKHYSKQLNVPIVLFNGDAPIGKVLDVEATDYNVIELFYTIRQEIEDTIEKYSKKYDCQEEALSVDREQDEIAWKLLWSDFRLKNCYVWVSDPIASIVTKAMLLLEDNQKNNHTIIWEAIKKIGQIKNLKDLILQPQYCDLLYLGAMIHYIATGIMDGYKSESIFDIDSGKVYDELSNQWYDSIENNWSELCDQMISITME